MLSRKQLQRYSRQIMLPQIGETGQERLGAAKVMIVGLGGLGSPAALYLAAAGVGELHLVDGDHVEISNLQRQVLFKTNHRGKDKAQVAAQQLTAANPEIRVQAHCRMADAAWLAGFLKEGNFDLVLDCTDNLDIRHVINRVCRDAKVPVIMASVRGFSGQLVSFDFRSAGSPCYACLFPPQDRDNDLPEAENCSTVGVIGPALGIMGSAQALEAIKLLAGLTLSSLNRLQLFEAGTLEWRTLALPVSKTCPVCV
ncbi:HesA/MoeB/ThiF family protein [Microbulbifer hydrolyticus]|uniref:HesA/MoeB/ThiF family protein n=1 Tax=Microbulbifer hydrolyticus TaxID=48074 RepID=A0A6P1TAM8_9GAMM|nr:HesA/MoeB/ThiF family protein [Microbulbifer hydrolyticus]MBB5213146.1 sulfur carrier protein ThiS adenylyltransferase [Microbulbifer hydrolyticus]QHQ38650.1 HesA/MoeB/ThiF family protein [Microbulbifer hydrolyticus]